jgi:hypothetical protein
MLDDGGDGDDQAALLMVAQMQSAHKTRSQRGRVAGTQVPEVLLKLCKMQNSKMSPQHQDDLLGVFIETGQVGIRPVDVARLLGDELPTESFADPEEYLLEQRGLGSYGEIVPDVKVNNWQGTNQTFPMFTWDNIEHVVRSCPKLGGELREEYIRNLRGIAAEVQAMSSELQGREIAWAEAAYARDKLSATIVECGVPERKASVKVVDLEKRSDAFAGAQWIFEEQSKRERKRRASSSSGPAASSAEQWRWPSAKPFVPNALATKLDDFCVKLEEQAMEKGFSSDFFKDEKGNPFRTKIPASALPASACRQSTKASGEVEVRFECEKYSLGGKGVKIARKIKVFLPDGTEVKWCVLEFEPHRAPPSSVR